MKVLCLVLCALTLNLAESASLGFRQAILPVHKISPRITGGEEVEPHSLPYQVGLYVSQDLLIHFCGGSLLSPNIVLTAAHCVENSQFVEVILGAHKIEEQEDTQVRLKSIKVQIHPGWEWIYLRNDIAIVVLPREVELNDYIQTVPLPASSDTDYVGDLAVASGWGLDSDSSVLMSPVLRKIEIPVISNEDCAEMFGVFVTNTSICASGADGKSTCNGDSGGPLVASTGEQIGITSFGAANNCEGGYPSVYTRVSRYLDWINQNMK